MLPQGVREATEPSESNCCPRYGRPFASQCKALNLLCDQQDVLSKRHRAHQYRSQPNMMVSMTMAYMVTQDSSYPIFTKFDSSDGLMIVMAEVRDIHQQPYLHCHEHARCLFTEQGSASVAKRMSAADVRTLYESVIIMTMEASLLEDTLSSNDARDASLYLPKRAINRE
ncbi:hypothetical protein H112_03536 [Trichophyton rubrum D6]|uniref:Uncharacterized protein n=2 Tax=Trichophyton TaxID=5550 RepID=A0A022W572_TRIRU|nr:hypothetical protein H100_03540 [Trichophyton rubrum MR850]EZF53565.1 hypothetical protein H103_03545 [Trichophyton rubrum CBS 288.86]EZF74767.1 hypothetical protein H105_03559 [Trichophyton soudanense CBS 452.61]EZF85431.1 hypothetical protein H110_03542 [Trichophyton rubrum MR1448]EZF96209.1 hypothetical protein H113_03563 [Trichophyton rubrum MR1459]EZG07235.1 hypothetical protein H106_03352 [Trichophyton rubrum CBS 735.88]EZG17829.1 hypothetical protein H107_03651 [Trichophyton rubrum 